MFDGPFETPADIAGSNSRYSVEQINKGFIPWLSPSRWGPVADARPIPAGTTARNFIKLVRKGGGEVYLPMGWLDLLEI
jgi:hypothetical protein